MLKLKRIPIVFIITVLFLYVSTCLVSGVSQTLDYSLTILGTNDIHGHFDTMAEYETIINQVRAEQKNVLLLDAGDIFRRGTYENYQGKIEAEIENAMGYNALVLGNNEFKVPGSVNSTGSCGTLKESDSQINNIIRWAQFPILCGNVKISKTKNYISGTKPYIINKINGVKIGIIGVTSTSPKDNSLDMAADKDFVQGEKAVKQLLPEVKKNSDIQIVLSHAGMVSDMKIQGVSAIIGGHDHLATYNPVVSNGIPIMQAGGEREHYLGRLDIKFKKQNNKYVLSKFEGKLYSAKGIKKDAAIQKIIDKYLNKPIPSPNVEKN